VLSTPSRRRLPDLRDELAERVLGRDPDDLAISDAEMEGAPAEWAGPISPDPRSWKSTEQRIAVSKAELDTSSQDRRVCSYP
jgi:hypothetical protein